MQAAFAPGALPGPGLPGPGRAGGLGGWVRARRSRATDGLAANRTNGKARRHRGGALMAAREGSRAVTRPGQLGPLQFPAYLGMPVWQFERARAAGLIPPPDTKAGKWSAAVAAAVLARVAEIKAAAGEVPDLGAVRAAAYLPRRLGAEVTGEPVEQLR